MSTHPTVFIVTLFVMMLYVTCSFQTNNSPLTPHAAISQQHPMINHDNKQLLQYHKQSIQILLHCFVASVMNPVDLIEQLFISVIHVSSLCTPLFLLEYSPNFSHTMMSTAIPR